MMGRAKSRIDATPRSHSIKIIINVVILVLMLLLKVWVRLLLEISAKTATSLIFFPLHSP